jgi:pimeloyl-ACP methyl ester carboxylesterase
MTPEQLTISIRKGHRAKVLTAGEGTPLVFLHGAGGLKWDPFLDELSKDYQVFAPYFPGLGGSSGSNQLDLRNWWDLVLYYYDLFDALELDCVDLIGHSFGGMLAAELAATEVKRVKHLILICAAGLWKEELPVYPPGSSTPEEMRKVLFYDPDSSVARQTTAVSDDPDERLQQLLDQQVALAETGRYMWPIPDKGLSRRLHRIKAQTCIIWGKHDRALPVDYAYEFKKGVPQAKVEVFDRSGHFPHLEQLAAVVQLTRSFLATDFVSQE